MTFKTYTNTPFFTEDYKKVRDFLIRVNRDRILNPRMLWGAWEWAVTHGGRDQENLDKIGLWEDGDKLVGVAMYECPLGEAYIIVDEAYPQLKAEAINYAKTALQKDGQLKLIIPDYDTDYARAARDLGFRPTPRRDVSCTLDIDALQDYSLPTGFHFTSLAENWNWYQYNRVMRRGFRPTEEYLYTDEIIAERKQMLSSPMIIPEIVIAVVAPDGNYVSHCGMWYRSGDFYCYVEPVATDSDFRKKGLGKAAVLEGIRRSGKLGAKQAIVGSEQQFYFNIGFYPTHYLTHWELN